jgi:hypothetical protein
LEHAQSRKNVDPLRFCRQAYGSALFLAENASFDCRIRIVPHPGDLTSIGRSGIPPILPIDIKVGILKFSQVWIETRK